MPRTADTPTAKRPTDEQLVRESRLPEVRAASAARAELTHRYRPLVHSRARRHLARNEADRQDLVAEAELGLQRAIRDFDLERGTPFAAYASARVEGTLRNWYRDQRYGPHVPRTLHEVHMRVRAAQGDLAASGTEPSIDEVAAHLGIEADEVVEALAVSSAERYRSAQLEAVQATSTTDVRHADLRVLLSELPERAQHLLHARFWGDQTQREVAEELDISQAQTSRLEARAVDRLRSAYLDAAPTG